MQPILRNEVINDFVEAKKEMLFEERIELFLHKTVKVWFAGIILICIPYFLYICLQFLFRF